MTRRLAGGSGGRLRLDRLDPRLHGGGERVVRRELQEFLVGGERRRRVAGVLVGGVKRLRSNEGQLSLVCSDRNITKIFEITGLDRVFSIYPSRDEALATIGASTT